MTNNELLLAISDMMDKKLDIRLRPIENQINRLENRMDSLENQMNRLENRMDSLENRMDVLENRVDGIENRMDSFENHLNRIEVELLENNVIPRLDTIESCYIDTYNRYKDYTDKMESEYDDMKLLKKVVAEHSEKLQNIS